MKLIYTWVEAHEAIANQLLHYRNRQPDLIEILQKAGVDKFEDELIKGTKASLAEIDPFTFFSYIYKHGALKNKKVLKEVCVLMNVNIEVKDVCGVPSTDARNVWYFPYSWERTNDEISRLWHFFENLLKNTVSDNDLQDVLQIKGVGKPKLLDGMFRIKPFDYLCLNGVVNPYLKNKKNIDPGFTNLSELQAVQTEIKNRLGTDFPKISYEAFIDAAFGQHVPRYFRIGSKDGKSGNSMLPVMLQNKIVSIGWHDLGDLDDITPISKTEIKEALINEGFYDDNRVASRKAGEILTFYKEIKPFDYVLAADGMAIKAIGRIVSENYIYETSFAFPHCRNVEWIKTDIDNLSIDEGLLTSVWQYEKADSIRSIEDYLGILGGSGSIPGAGNPVNLPPFPKLPDYPLNIILYGPPGTGKTYQTIDKAVEIIKGTSLVNHIQNKEEFDKLKEEEQISFITFHQNYTYEDFMIGIKPNVNSTTLSFKDHQGIFYKIVQDAKNAYQRAVSGEQPKRFVLIIDEINRANISRVFGELITLLEDDKRIGGDNELSVKLANGEDFAIPSNLYIIGTMNTADKSIALVDIALRRRFEFIGKYPDYNVLKEECPERESFLRVVNSNIYKKRNNADYLIGHAYLLKKDKLEDIIKKKLIPLLMEYFNGRIQEVTSIFEGTDYDIKYDENFYEWQVDLKRVADEN